ncbi:ribonuclease P protein component [Olivibacter sp. CPCC 100613]|uniref:ribonuclease P protein component n=1 Tax=Olivibacter sp. CPCC 100613 TaxID=3079931 RepID=UPI002FF76075
MVRYTFKKEERLCNRKLLTKLFQSGSSFILYPYRISFLESRGLPNPIQVVISVPKRRFKRAVDRNLLKRRIRESYRLQKHSLYGFATDHQIELLIAFQYIGKEIANYPTIHKRMGIALAKIQHEYNTHHMAKGN